MGKSDFTFEYLSSSSSDGNDSDEFVPASSTETAKDHKGMAKKKKNIVSTVSSSSSPTLPSKKKLKVEKNSKQQRNMEKKSKHSSHSTTTTKTTVNDVSNKMQSLPDHWPVSSHRIKENVKDPNIKLKLTPGSILKNCSGSDIKISKNSDAKPTMGRGKYLFFLPGLLSLRQPSLSSSQPHEQKEILDDSIVESQEHSNSQEEASQETKTTQSSTKKISPTTLMTLGKVTNLYTQNPILTIPLPNGQSLEFLGKKIKCASKYLMLTFKTSGAVNCRNTFQEIVVFGDYSINGDGDETTESLSLESNAILEPIQHYGGSERALDGGREIRGQKSMKAATNNDLTQSSSQLSQQLLQDNLSQDHIEIQDSDNDDNDRFKVDSPAPPPREKSSRRSSTFGKKVKYAELLESDASSSDDEYDVSDKEADEKKILFTRKKSRRTSGCDTDDDGENDDGSYKLKNAKKVPQTPPNVNTKKRESSISKLAKETKNSKVVDLNQVQTNIEIEKNAPIMTKVSKQTVSSANKSKMEVVKSTMKTPSPYSGRKRKNSTPNSGKKIFDISMDDDEFVFIE